jgi:omega-6 fatty acid desaturase (delta-12 desaturase)
MTVRHIVGDGILWCLLLSGRHLSDGVGMSFALACGLSIFYFRSFSMMHECVHYASSTSRRHNDIIGNIYGVFCFLPFRSWRDVHLNHHMWTGNVEKDPSSRILFEFKKAGYKTARYVIWSWKNWVPVLGFLQHVVFWKATRSKSELFFVALSVLLLGFTATKLGVGTTLVGLVIYLYMVEIINFPHHLGMPQFEGDARFPADAQAQFTRSCVYPKWFAHHVLLNFNLHTEHHLFPAHPWYALDELHAEISRRGLLLNRCESNDWILENRSKPIEELMRQTFVVDKKDTRSA